MNYHSAALTDVGCVRQNNEDSFFADPAHGLFVVADGMGGHAAGEVASSMAVRLIGETLRAAEGLRTRFEKTQSADDAEQLMRAVEDAVRNAGREIFSSAQSNPERAGIGTTCSAIVLAGRKGVLAHVGDSRVYVARNRAIYQLSEDHTFVAEQVRRGLLTREEAAVSKLSNLLTRALGPVETTPVDVMLFDVDPGDRFLLCSDGLHNYFKDASELLRVLLGETLDDVLQTLIGSAKQRGGHDNITGIVVEAAGDESQDSAGHRIAMLRKIPLFRHLSYPELVKVLSLMQTRVCEGGDMLIKEGAVDDSLFVCTSGELEVTSGGVVLASLKKGDHVGEMSLVDRSPRSANVVCKVRSRLLRMDRAHFHDIIRREPVIATKLLFACTQELSMRLREANSKIAAIQSDEHTLPEEIPFDDVEGTVRLEADEES